MATGLLGFPRMTDSTKPASEPLESSRSVRLWDALEKSERSFRELIDGVEDYAIFLLDREGRVASWNAGAQRIKGWAAEEILGRHFSVFYVPEAVASGWPDCSWRKKMEITPVYSLSSIGRPKTLK